MQGFQRYLLLIYSKFTLYRCSLCFDAWLPFAMKCVYCTLYLRWNLCVSLLYFALRECVYVNVVVKKVHVRYFIC